MEFNDIYDKDRQLTGRLHRRGSRWRKGEYGLVVCVWVHDGKGNLLLTRRAKGKTYAGTWENSGGGAQAGETSLQAIRRELFEETGIQAEEQEFELLETTQDSIAFYDHYCLHREVSLDDIVLQPGETDAVQWASFQQVQQLIDSHQICDVISRQFLRQAPLLQKRQITQSEP